MARWIVVAALLVPIGAALLSPMAQAQTLPDDARGFVDWCQQRGLEAKDAKGNSCSMTISMVVLLTSFRYKQAPACEPLTRTFPTVVQPIYQWLIAHPDQIHGSSTIPIMAAVKALYECPP